MTPPVGHQMFGPVAKRIGIALLSATACLYGFSPAVQAAGPKPAKPLISGLAATPATVPSGGATAVTASVVNALQCTISSSKPVAGLPETSSCESGSISRSIMMPTNIRKKAVQYTLTLTATGAGGKAKATTKVSVDPATQGTGLQVAAQAHTCAVLSNGRIQCWGMNESGQLGNGTITGTVTPVEVKGITSAVQVVVGSSDSCALLSSGHIQCWGEDALGQLGDGNSSGSDTPVEVQGITNATRLTSGALSTCALLSTGHVECWGWNTFGQLGDGNNSSANVPMEVRGLSNVTQVVAGAEHTCAVLSSGHIQCWGLNEHAQLGNGSTAQAPQAPK